MRVLILASVIFMAGCGQTGPLFLPDKEGSGQVKHGHSHGSF